MTATLFSSKACLISLLNLSLLASVLPTTQAFVLKPIPSLSTPTHNTQTCHHNNHRPSIPTFSQPLRTPPPTPTTIITSPLLLPHTHLYSSTTPSQQPPLLTPNTANNNNKLDKTLSFLTSCFPLFVATSATLGALFPPSLLWVTTTSPNLIPLMLALVMTGTGMTLSTSDFANVFRTQPRAIPLGVACQFGIMPLAAYFVGKTLFGFDRTHPAAYLGLILVGCCPGGTASNLVSLVAKADVALSVLLTTCSTLLASLVTPLLVTLLAGGGGSFGGGGGVVRVSGVALGVATAKVVLGPVVLGMFVKTRARRFSEWVGRFAPFASVVLVALICGGVVAENAVVGSGGFGVVSGDGGFIMRRLVVAVACLHSLGFGVGYLVPRFFGFKEMTARTVSIETGMQNSALAVVLAKSCGAGGMAALPGALSATMHSCIGSGLAAYWRFVDERKRQDNGSAS